MRLTDLTRSILFPLALPALVSFLWFAGWASAFAAQADRGMLPPVRVTNSEQLRAEIDAGPDAAALLANPK